MKLSELLLAELEREAVGTRHALERVPEGHNNWKPHPKSMEFGYLAALVARLTLECQGLIKVGAALCLFSQTSVEHTNVAEHETFVLPIDSSQGR